MNYIRDIKHLLLELGINHSYSGYEYVIYGTCLVIEDKTRLNYITKALYLDIAIKFNTSWQRVERNIRTVVHAIWKTENKELLQLICGGIITKRPKNKEFFLLLSDYVISLYNPEIAATRNFPNDIKSPVKEGRIIGKYLKEKGYSKKDVELLIRNIINYFDQNS